LNDAPVALALKPVTEKEALGLWIAARIGHLAGVGRSAF
jgi:hypothetical protein